MHIKKKIACGMMLSLAIATAAVGQLTAQSVRESIARGVQYLKSQQDKERGAWPEYPNFAGGATSLCTLALLNAGLPKDDPSIRRALAYLQRLGNPQTTYATSLQTMVFCAADPEAFRLKIRQNVDWLEKTQIKTGSHAGGWTYKETDKSTKGDNSNSQFAVLALNEAQRTGVLVRKSTWERSVQYWGGQQAKNGAWGYRFELSNAGHTSGSMTCAGISSLLISVRSLSQGDARVTGGTVVCCGKQETNDRIERGLAWLGRNFSVTTNPGRGAHGGYLLYYLYGIERVGRLTGNRFIGQHDWYREGAAMLVAAQDQLGGGWSGNLGGSAGKRRDLATAFALLFLSKGRRPVLVSKLKFTGDNDWNRHRRDLHNLTEHVERLWKRNMNWQVVDINAAGVQDLLQSPVLFLSGRSGLRLNNIHKETLRDYINQGGFLFAEACCNSEKFDRQFRALMKELFPDSELRLLPPSHPVWFAEQAVDPNQIRPLYGLESCCRTSVVYCPENLGCFWELARGLGTRYPEPIQNEVDSVLAIGANVLAYATGRQLRDKLDVPQLAIGDERSDSFERGALQIAKIDHNGGSDDAPAALMNLLRVAQEQIQFPVRIETRLLSIADKNVIDYPLLFIHGRREFQFDGREREALEKYVKNGGVVFGDSICASQSFLDSFRREMELVFPEHEWKRIPPSHPMFTDEFRGFDVAEVQVRRPRERIGDEPLEANLTRISPLLEGLEIDGRYVVIFSPYDISCALENHSSLDCEGYIREDAARLGVNIVMYALQQ